VEKVIQPAAMTKWAGLGTEVDAAGGVCNGGAEGWMEGNAGLGQSAYVQSVQFL
jgi:hypothetical protein